VLLRAGRVVEGLALARERRGAAVPHAWLARGPGCLCQALGISGADNGTDLLMGGPLMLSAPAARHTSGAASVDSLPAVIRGPRVGVSQAPDLPWRFWVAGDASVSAYRRSPRAAPPGS